MAQLMSLYLAPKSNKIKITLCILLFFRSVHRRRADPRISMATTFHDVFSDFKSVEGSEDLMHPVNAKKVPDYYDMYVITFCLKI